ncbi:hypothetical protein [Saccharibacillus deserti]|uniref:hypothetical protein n=1 Tax=Saccharibacillus deserti TaxID=1634444 RepID=UPI0015576317|nr:hypothetical protein [Saccharibacillus deserti]
MSRGESKKWKKWPLAAFVLLVAGGGAYALPNVFANEADGQTIPSVRQTATVSAGSKGALIQSESVGAASAASVQAKVVAPVIAADPKRTSITASRKALIKLGMMNLSTGAASDFYSSENALRKLHLARNQANKVTFDPKASADQIFYASRKLEKAIDLYNASAVSSADVLGKILKYEKAAVRNGENEHSLNEIELLALKGIKEAQAKLAADSTEAGVQAAYKHFLSSNADVNDLRPFDRADNVSFLQRYKENYAAEIAGAGSRAKEAVLQRKAYENAAKAMQSAIDAKSGKNELTVAGASVINTYSAFLEGMRLSDALNQARPLLHSPVGKEEGQYTASSIGTLRSAINQAESSLKQSEMREELADAQKRLAVSVRAFKASRK